MPSDTTSLQDAGAGLRGTSKALGNFNQEKLRAIEGWDDHDAGYALECTARKIIAEVKNKCNPMNDSNRAKVEDDLLTALKQKKGQWTAYIVQIIPQKPKRNYNSVFTRCTMPLF